jgi:NAD(P)H-dependent FMN reductase
VLKNALDWAARPAGDNPFRGDESTRARVRELALRDWARFLKGAGPR